MGLLKHTIPKETRRRVVKSVDSRLSDGFVRNNLANAETLGGVALVALGAQIDGKVGLVMRVFGEALDDIDGDTARAFGIDSKLGAKLDPIVDKIKMLIELRKLWGDSYKLMGDERLKRQLSLGIIAGKHAVNTSLNIAAFAARLEPASSRVGQVNMWVDGVAVSAFSISDVLENPEQSKRFADVGYFATAVGVPTGIVAASGYANNLMQGLISRRSES